MIRIYIASDYNGVNLRKQILSDTDLSKEIEFIDLGIEQGSTLDYIDISKTLADELYHNTGAMGIMICGSGQGVAIALNRFHHVRATACFQPGDAINVREKLNANVLCLGSKHLDLVSAKSIIQEFINTHFYQEKHAACVNKLAPHATQHTMNGINLIVRAVILHEGHILLTTATSENKNFSEGLFFLPGGHVDYNEPILSALHREIWEEMHLEFVQEELVGVVECSWNRKGSVYHELDVIYKIEIPGLNLSQPPKAMDHNFHQFIWKNLDDLEDLIILPKSLKDIIKDVATHRKPIRLLSEMISR